MAGVLSKNDIRRLIEAKPPLIECWVNLDEQLQPNGFDLTVRGVAILQTAGKMGITSRYIPEPAPLVFDGLGFIDLMPGAYSITYNEIVHIPNNIMAIARPRSSLLRCGVNIGTAVWDAGYNGRSESLMVVYNPCGFRLQQNARVLQLIFFELTGETEGYKGRYQGENI